MPRINFVGARRFKRKESGHWYSTSGASLLCRVDPIYALVIWIIYWRAEVVRGKSNRSNWLVFIWLNCHAYFMKETRRDLHGTSMETFCDCILYIVQRGRWKRHQPNKYCRQKLILNRKYCRLLPNDGRSGWFMANVTQCYANEPSRVRNIADLNCKSQPLFVFKSSDHFGANCIAVAQW